MKAPNEKSIIQIDVTNACTHRCSNCTRFCGFHKKPYFMDIAYFYKAVNTLIDRDGIIGVMGGEPTLHPQFEEMCTYLRNNLPKDRLPNKELYKYPTPNYIETVNRQRILCSRIGSFGGEEQFYPFGAGLWTSITPLYWKNLENILEVFSVQLLNTHDSISYHQPILLSRKALGIGDDEWIKLRENCWLNHRWSGSVNPKGIFFCEVAGTLDMLFNGPGGHRLEEGWWKKPIEAYEDQFHWCEMCGLALMTPSRNANDEVTDISEDILARLRSIESVDLDRNKINMVKIEAGKVTNIQHDKYHGGDYLTNSKDRHIPLNVNRIVNIILTSDKQECEEVIENNLNYCDEVLVVKNGSFIARYTSDNKELSDGKATITELKKMINKNDWILISTDDIKIEKEFDKIKRYVINPGLLFYVNMAKSKRSNPYIRSCNSSNKGKCMFFSLYAHSLIEELENLVLDERIFPLTSKSWNPEKRVSLSGNLKKHIINESIVIDRLQNSTIWLKTYVDKNGISKLAEFEFQKLRHKGVKEFLDAKRNAWNTGM